MDELEDFVACGEKFTRFRDHRSMPLTGGFGRMKFDQVEKLAEKKCIRLVYTLFFFLLSFNRSCLDNKKSKKYNVLWVLT